MDNKIAVKLTKSIVDKINPVLDKDQVFYRDENALITREMIAKRHAEYGTTNSKARSHYAMRVLRASISL